MTQAIGAAEGHLTPNRPPGAPGIGAKTSGGAARFFIDHAPRRGAFLADVIDGLVRRPRTVPAKYFFDDQGARLFKLVSETPEHYLARCEHEILSAAGPELASLVGHGLCIIEYGAYLPEAIRRILRALRRPAAYVAIDLSRRQAVRSARTIGEEFPHLSVAAVCADIGAHFELPHEMKARPKLAFLPAWTTGILDSESTVLLLRRMRAQLGAGSRLIAGIDLVKDPSIIRAAYNDSFGATAAFNLNLLGRMKRELGAMLDVADFTHRADFDPIKSRVELCLAARRETAIGVGGRVFTFASGEAIHTASAHKHTHDGFASLAAEAGFERAKAWNDDQRLFGVQLLQAV